MFFRVQVIQGPGFLGSRFFRVRVQELKNLFAIDIIVVKKTYIFLNYIYVRLKWKRKVNAIITINIEYAWIFLDVPI